MRIAPLHGPGRLVALLIVLLLPAQTLGHCGVLLAGALNHEHHPAVSFDSGSLAHHGHSPAAGNLMTGAGESAATRQLSGDFSLTPVAEVCSLNEIAFAALRSGGMKDPLPQIFACSAPVTGDSQPGYQQNLHDATRTALADASSRTSATLQLPLRI
jgi:hypothetical protein